MLNIVYRYTFVNEHCPEIEDDAFDSRKNEINFGSPFEDIRYMFDDSKNTKENYKRNEFEIQTNLFHKRYVFGVVRPDIVVKEGKYYETEVVYGFISSVPFSSFFSDLNRVFQRTRPIMQSRSSYKC